MFSMIPPPSLWHPFICMVSVWTGLFWTFHTNGIMECMAFVSDSLSEHEVFRIYQILSFVMFMLCLRHGRAEQEQVKHENYYD